MTEIANVGRTSRRRHSGRATLVQSGPTTRGWLRTLRDELGQHDYAEAAYYASFRSDQTHGAFAYLNPARYSIRLFVRLEPNDDGHLRKTPSTHHWAKRFPSVFTIRGESDLQVARSLIEKSYARARTLS